MINATVTVPDHPQTANFNPTQIKDIKAADPGSQVNLIDPPKATSHGDARLSYPIEVPPGRQGLQPQVGAQYSSSAGNGWMGMGWDLPMQAVTIDTRFGVPRYDAGLETETDMLSGEMLTPVAHRGELVGRTLDKVFHTRVEGQFKRIIRRGNHPSNYTWEVTDKNGVKYLYGATDPATETLSDAAGNRFLWALCEIRDPNGNFVKYRYARVDDPGVAGGSVPGRNIYLSRITYTGNGLTEGLYAVTFFRDRDRDLAEPRRLDVQIDARGGFKRVTADLLRKVEVWKTVHDRAVDHESNAAAAGARRCAEVLVGLDPGRLDDRPPLFDLRFVVRAERLRRLLVPWQDFLAEVHQALAHAVVGRGIDHRRVEPRDDRGRRAARYPESVPDRHVIPRHARFVDRRDVGRDR
jgi:hypothetical protein